MTPSGKLLIMVRKHSFWRCISNSYLKTSFEELTTSMLMAMAMQKDRMPKSVRYVMGTLSVSTSINRRTGRPTSRATRMGTA